MNYRDALEYREYCLSYYRDSKKAVSLSPTKYSIQIEIETTDTLLIYLRATSTNITEMGSDIRDLNRWNRWNLHN